MFAFEKALVYHCSPTLSGLKPANPAFSFQARLSPLPELAEEYSLLLSSRGFSWKLSARAASGGCSLFSGPRCSPGSWQTGGPLRCCGRRAIRSSQTGPLDLAALLSHLKKRLSQSEGFPHEIGLFLGYPLEDVIGFCRHKGEGCKLCGYWKVYGDVESARKSFALFDRCRELLFSHLLSGAPLQELVGEQPFGRIKIHDLLIPSGGFSYE